MNVDISNAWKQLQSLGNDVVTMLPNLLLAGIFFLISLLVARYTSKIVRSLSYRAGQGRGVGLLLGRIAQYIVVILGVLIALSVVFPSFKAKDLIQVLGIGGVAIGFAFKDIFQNFLAGVIILISRPFRIGDQIIVKEFEGTVEDIQTRATVIRTYDHKKILIPNSVVFTDEVTVLTDALKRRTEYEIGIGYGDDIATAKSIILDTIAKIDIVEKEPAPDVLTVGIDASWVTLRVRWWSANQRADVLNTQDRVLTDIKNALTAAGIDLPFPVQTVLFHDQTEETDGNRKLQREGWPAGKGPVPESAREFSDRARSQSSRTHQASPSA